MKKANKSTDSKKKKKSKYNVVTKKNNKKTKKVKKSSFNDWNFADHTYVPEKNVELLATSNLKERNFRGATTKKGQAYGPVAGGAGTSGTMASAVSGAIGGYGNSSYGFSAYGESINTMNNNLSKFISELPSDCNDSIIPALTESYNEMFKKVANTGNVIMLGIQPSFANYMKFDIPELVNQINSFNGNILSVFLGEESGFEPIEIIVDWYESIGISGEAISKMIFVEKTDSIFKNVNKMRSSVPVIDNIDSGDDNANVYHYFIADSIDTYSDLLQWNEVALVGCIDPYLLAETMFVLNNKEYAFDIDTNYIFTSLTDSDKLSI